LRETFRVAFFTPCTRQKATAPVSITKVLGRPKNLTDGVTETFAMLFFYFEESFVAATHETKYQINIKPLATLE